MKKEQKNYKEFDYQTILIKKDKFDEVVQSYQSFGWTIFDQKQHDKYENILEVVFEREHFVKNKDQLQFLQVGMEIDINKKGQLEKRKHAWSISFGTTFGVLSLGMIVFAGFSFFIFEFLLGMLLGIGFAILGLSSMVALSFVIKKIVKKENEKFKTVHAKLEQSISSYCQKAKSLIGAKDE